MEQNGQEEALLPNGHSLCHVENFGTVSLFRISESENESDCDVGIVLQLQLLGGSLKLSLDDGLIRLGDAEIKVRFQFPVSKYECLPLSLRLLAFHLLDLDMECTLSMQVQSFGIRFNKQKDLLAFRKAIRLASKNGICDFGQKSNIDSGPLCKRKRILENGSEFDTRTEEASAAQYFQFYGFLYQQQNMMQDYTRTSTYQQAILINSSDFKDKVVMDVGAGSGILSFFAIQAGAKRVYAIEASSMATHCRALVHANGMENRIKVIAGKVEEIELPEQVDLIISEPMGYMLVNERMLESYMYAKKFLKDGGRMFPTKAELHLALFSDEASYLEQSTRCSFWGQDSFHGVNLSTLKQAATKEAFAQPIVDSFHPDILISKSTKWTIDFEKDSASQLQCIEIPFDLTVNRSGYLHGVAAWFDVAFIGSVKNVWLSTAPSQPLTHWYQVRCLTPQPMLVQLGQKIRGHLIMQANDKQSYDIRLDVESKGKKLTNELDLKQPYFRYNGQSAQPPPGSYAENPSDQLNQAFDQYGSYSQAQEYMYQDSYQDTSYKSNQLFNQDPANDDDSDLRHQNLSTMTTTILNHIPIPPSQHKFFDQPTSSDDIANKMVAESAEGVENTSSKIIAENRSKAIAVEINERPLKLDTDEYFYYFAYGSNLLKERINVQVKDAVFEEVGVLRDHQLAFYGFGSRWMGAAASIEVKPGSEVWGCVWRVANSFSGELDKQEKGYQRLDVDVLLRDERRLITCRTYRITKPDREAQLPSPHYKHVILSGAIEHDLPPAYVQFLRELPHNGYKGRVLLDLNAIEHLNRGEPEDGDTVSIKEDEAITVMA